MSWMKLHGAVLDIAGRLVHLDSPVYGKMSPVELKKYITLGLYCVVCGEEGQRATFMCGLPPD
jgi:hypothetical protein